ncbi:MAG: site-specific DNA-methyltransferase [Alphaproteobacteria bacterium]|nr:site-specific DNA-methyltransferase [Alphaproteobacteria bacterium]
MSKTPAPRNKTIFLSPEEIEHYSSRSITLNKKSTIDDILDKTIYQDTFEALPNLPANFADLVVVDPPYNLTKKFGTKEFKSMDWSEYKKWMDKWLAEVFISLKPNGTLYICSDWNTSIAIPEIAGKYFLLKNRITWEREKGRSSGNNWKNCIEDIWFFTKSPEYTFNLDAVKLKRPVLAPYKDEQGIPKDWQEDAEDDGKKYRLTAPSNLWTDISIPFWSMAENTPHPTQKPEKLIAKLILASSNEGDVVFDPFLGSGTTSVTAKKLNRHYVGIEREKEYVAIAEKRLEMANENKTIQGYEKGIFKLRNE